ncbi:MAG: XisI protein [Microcystis aeruginosa LL13-03]|nr:XisI protein [Microcystis aeruginosa LL13-03]
MDKDKLIKYRQAVQNLLSRYVAEDVTSEDVEVQLIFDVERDHYQWMNVGWEGNKIWLQQNLTELNPAEDLISMGVKREDIVLGLQPPYKRPYTNYGT